VPLQESGYETAFTWISFRGREVDLATDIAVDGKSSKVDGYMTEMLNDQAVASRRTRVAPAGR
jgi:hypothetical protein